MALRFIDGFDHYSTITHKWTSATQTPSFSSSNTRFGVGSYIAPAGAIITKGFDNQATWVLGVAVKLTALPANTVGLMGFNETGSAQMGLSVTTAGNLVVTRGGTVLATSTYPVIVIDVWNYIEFKVTINDTTGAYEVKLNGVTVTGLSASGVDTQNTTNAYANAIFINGASIAALFDDLYLCDGTGGTNDDFLGDVRVDTIRPTADTAQSDFTPSTGTDNYAMVDDTTPNSDTDYVYSSTVGHIDLYTYADLQSTTGAVYGLQSAIFARKDDAGTRSLAPAIKTGATTAFGSDIALAASYAYGLQIFETNPANSNAAWTISDVNSSEFGFKVTA